MVRDQLGEGVFAAHRPFLQPSPRRRVQASSLGPRQRLIRHFADEDVAEDVAVAISEANQIFVDQPFECSGRIGCEMRGQRADPLRPERASKNRSELQHPSFRCSEQVQPGQNRRLHGVRQLGQRFGDGVIVGGGRNPFHHRTDNLSGEEWVALRALDDQGLDARGGLSHQVRDELGHRVIRERL